jgi:hypothetical protein
MTADSDPKMREIIRTIVQRAQYLEFTSYLKLKSEQISRGLQFQITKSEKGKPILVDPL